MTAIEQMGHCHALNFQKYWECDRVGDYIAMPEMVNSPYSDEFVVQGDI